MWADDEELITNKCLYSCFNLHGKDIQLEALHSDRPSYHISAKFSQVFNFANFVNIQPFVKIFQQKF